MKSNPGLAHFELSHYKGVDGTNFFQNLPSLQHYLQACIPDAELAKVKSHLTSLGELAGGKLNDLVFAAHKEGKYGTLEKFDRHGERIDDIKYCNEQLEVRRLAFEAGIVNLDQHPSWQQPFRYEHRESCAYLMNLNGEGGVTCPLAMTEGMIEILRAHGTEDQKKNLLPMLVDPKSSSHFMAGQYLTERVGGSNVGANRTIAEKNEDGQWLLTGEKWFCSNPGDIWVTTAKIKGSKHIGVFLVSRFKKDGSLNEHHIMRLKDIIGSRGKVTAEVEYRGVEAEMVGRPHTGLALVMRHVIAVSRVHTGLGACALARRSFWEARAYAKTREAFANKIIHYHSIQRTLAQMQLELFALETLIFKNWTLRVQENPLFDILTPLLKFSATSRGTQITHEAIIVHGGNGIVGDYSVLPRLLNDGVINETWEGTHNIIAGHTLKAWGRKKCFSAWEAFIQTALNSAEKWRQDQACAAMFAWIDSQINWLKNADAKKIPESNYIAFCDKIFEVTSLVNLIGQAQVYCHSENDFKAGDKQVPWQLLCLGWHELIVNGPQGLLDDGSVLLNENYLLKIIAV